MVVARRIRRPGARGRRGGPDPGRRHAGGPGPYATEPETLARIHHHRKGQKWVMGGHHHEISLSDPRRGDPARAQTILRIPVRRP